MLEYVYPRVSAWADVGSSWIPRDLHRLEFSGIDFEPESDDWAEPLGLDVVLRADVPQSAGGSWRYVSAHRRMEVYRRRRSEQSERRSLRIVAPPPPPKITPPPPISYEAANVQLSRFIDRVLLIRSGVPYRTQQEIWESHRDRWDAQLRLVRALASPGCMLECDP